MRYLKIEWIHKFPGEPILFYSELNAENWELRKVEIFRDGKMNFYGNNLHIGSSGLSKEPLPSNEEIIADKQFLLNEIDAIEFHLVWNSAIAANVLNKES